MAAVTLLAGLYLSIFPAQAQTQTFNWIGTTSNVWNDAANWMSTTPTAYPNSITAVANFTSTPGATISFSAPPRLS